MILKQYYLGCLAHASYLLGDETSSTAIVVDPQRDIQQYLADAAEFGLRIRHVFLTHLPLRCRDPSRLPRPGGIPIRGHERWRQP
jgi:glyoxylase-like metal-dependent hydrolase (beta-lactamase superfamily II)